METEEKERNIYQQPERENNVHCSWKGRRSLTDVADRVQNQWYTLVYIIMERGATDGTIQPQKGS